MDYSKDFRDLIACTKDTEDFIGYGNPNAKILIIGKEESFDIKKGENNIIYNQASKGNWKGWEEVIGNPSITPDSIPVWKDSGKFCPLYPWKGDDLPKGTWTNYQKLINCLYPEADAGKMTTFHQYAFITEFNDSPSKTSKRKDTEVQKSIKHRCENVLNHPFYKSFPIVIAACGHYVGDYNINLEDIFNQKYIEPESIKIRTGEWINIHRKDNRILIHTRQLSNAFSFELIERIANFCKPYIEPLQKS